MCRQLFLGAFIGALVLSGTSSVLAKNRYLSRGRLNVSERKAQYFEKQVQMARVKVNTMLDRKGLDTIPNLPPANTLAGKLLEKIHDRINVDRPYNRSTKSLTYKQLRTAAKAYASFEGMLGKRHNINAYTYFQAKSDIRSDSIRAMGYIQRYGRNFGRSPKWTTSSGDVLRVIGKELDRVAAKTVRSFQ